MNTTCLAGKDECCAGLFEDRDVLFLRCRDERKTCVFRKSYKGLFICTCPVNRASFNLNRNLNIRSVIPDPLIKNRTGFSFLEIQYAVTNLEADPTFQQCQQALSDQPAAPALQQFDIPVAGCQSFELPAGCEHGRIE